MHKKDGDSENPGCLKEHPGCRRLQKNSWQLDKFTWQMKRPQGLVMASTSP